MNSRSRNRFFTAIKSAFAALLLFPATLAFCASPTAVSVTPSSGTGTVQTFSFAFSDADGVADLSWVYAEVLPNASNVGPACAVYYHPQKNLIYLGNGSTGEISGAGAVGSPGHLSNSQCTIDVGASSTSVTGNTLTLNVAITFHITADFNGPTRVYLYAVDKQNNNSGVQQRGTWNVGSYVAPTPVSVSPSAGSGPVQTFAFTYSDTNGTADLSRVYAYFAPSVNTDLSCYFWYDPGTNLIYLADDYGGAVGPGAVGKAGKLRNYECVLDVGASSVSRTANTLTLNVPVSFNAQPAGPRNIYMYAKNKAGLSSAPQVLGTYTIQYGPLYALSVINSPAGYHANRTTFNLTFFDSNGGSSIRWIYILLSPSNNSSHACPIYVHMPSQEVYLGNDTNSATVGPSRLGTADPRLSNSQCTVDMYETNTYRSFATVGPTTLTLNLAVTFASSFYGPLNIITYAADRAGYNSGYQHIGTYTVPAPTAPTYASVSQSTSTAFPSASTVYTTYKDANGSPDLKTLYFLIGPSLDVDASCYVRYEIASNSIYLSDDAGGWLPPGHIGNTGGGSLSNYECTIDTLHSGALPGVFYQYLDQTAYFLSVPIPKYWAPSGMVLNIYMNAVDNEGNSAGWVLKGTYTVP